MKRLIQRVFRRLFHKCDHQYVIKYDRISPRVFQRNHQCIYCGKIRKSSIVVWGTAGDAVAY